MARNAYALPLFLTLFCFMSTPLFADDAVVQKLDRNESSITFSATSPQPLQGSVRSFTGQLIQNGSSPENLLVNFSVDLQSIQLPPEQIMQAIFVQTALQYIKERILQFKSDSVKQLSKNDLLLHGTYSWMGKQRQADVPVKLVAYSNSQSKFTLGVSGEARDSAELRNVTGGNPLRGRVSGVLVFKKN